MFLKTLWKLYCRYPVSTVQLPLRGYVQAFKAAVPVLWSGYIKSISQANGLDLVPAVFPGVFSIIHKRNSFYITSSYFPCNEAFKQRK